LIERLVIGSHAFIGAGAVVTADVDPDVLMVAAPAKFKKSLKNS
jgi:acetyltransferase-like isoleucine patch superfamily enzyme